MPQNVIYIIFTEKTCIDKLCMGGPCRLTRAERRILNRLWWLKKHGYSTAGQRHGDKPRA